MAADIERGKGSHQAATTTFPGPVLGKPPQPILCITEKWVRQRLNLQLDSLEDVRSLALPGSYSEKVTHLGRSLAGFTRLKFLDLSRNAIESLEGLEHLHHLETLNLYYNNVASLAELFRLRHNAKLKELDLRLNPVTKHEPDYRLFVVHMLVNLRKLDDRGVRDSERKAALMHFDTTQAHDFDEKVQTNLSLVRTTEHESPPEVSKHVKSRTQLVQSLAPRPTALEDNTDALLDLIARNDELLTPTASTPSRHKSSTKRSPSYLQGTGLPSQPTSMGIPVPTAGLDHASSNGPYSTFGDNLETVGETESCLDLRVPGNFTPAPPRVTSRSTADLQLQAKGKSTGGRGYASRSQLSGLDIASAAVARDGTPRLQQPQPLIATGTSQALEALLDLLQGHVPCDLTELRGDNELKGKLDQWLEGLSVRHHRSQTGSELRSELDSLQEHLQLKDSIVQQKESDLVRLRQLLKQRESEAAVLGRQLQGQTDELDDLRQNSTAGRENQRLLKQAAVDISTLRRRLQVLQDENVSLKAAAKDAPMAAQVSTLQKHMRDLEGEKQSLREELKAVVERHHQDLQTSLQIQELAVLLQEAHRSLVSTNDHLLQELEEVKHRHSQEVAQMDLNYKQLRKTIDFMQHI